MPNCHGGRSEYVLKRLLLLRNLEAPTISDTKKNYGDELRERIFCVCDQNIKEDLGLEPPLKGPIGKDLWSSPSDLMIGKVCLKPPLTSNHIKALTHQGILDIGLKIEKLFWNEVEIEKSKELEEQDRTLRLMCETSKKQAITEVQKRMMEIFRSQKLELIEEMEELSRKEIKRLKCKFAQDLQDELKEQARELEGRFKSDVEVIKLDEHVEIKSEKSDTNLEEFEMYMYDIFQQRLQEAELEAQFEIKKIEAAYKNKIESLRKEFQCKTLADLMLIVSIERSNLEKQKSDLETKYTKEIYDLETILKSKEEDLSRIKYERDKHKKEVELREKAMLEIIKEFQKFINFTFKSTPKQAEYLLCAEKLMVFDLSNALSKVDVVKGENEIDDHDRNYLYTKTPPEEISLEGSLEVEDGHECLKESEINDSELSLDQFLPGFYFNNQLFVREDFRNKVTQGKVLKEKDLLWNKKVQHIIEELQKSPDKSLTSSDESLVLEESSTSSSTEIAPEKQETDIKPICICKSIPPNRFEKKEKKKIPRMGEEGVLYYGAMPPSDVHQIVDAVKFQDIGREEHRKSLLAARDSLDILRKKFVKHESSTSSSTDGSDLALNIPVELKEVEFTTDEEPVNIIEYTSEEKSQEPALSTKTPLELNTSEEDINVASRNSRLLTARDSLEIIRSSKSSLEFGIHSSADDVAQDETEVDDISEEKISNTDYEFTDVKTKIPELVTETPKLVFHPVDELDLIIEKELSKKPQKLKFAKTKNTSIKVKSDKIKKKINVKKMVEKKESTAKVVMGDSKLDFTNQTNEQFTVERISSFINIIKEHPALIRLFTSVTR